MNLPFHMHHLVSLSILSLGKEQRLVRFLKKPFPERCAMPFDEHQCRGY